MQVPQALHAAVCPVLGLGVEGSTGLGVEGSTGLGVEGCRHEPLVAMWNRSSFTA